MASKTPAKSATPPHKSDPNFVHSLAKGLDILSIFAEGDMLGNQQLVERTGLPKATVSRITSTLTALGYLRVDARTRKLMMGSRLVGMGASVQRRIGLQRIARPMLEKLSADTGLSLIIGTRDRLGLIVLDAIRPPTDNRLVTNVDAGTVLPIAGTAIGLAYIVAAPVKEQAAIFDKLAQRFPADWPLLRQRIEHAHAEFNRTGFVTTQRSWERDVNGVAIPFAPNARNALYAVSFAGPVARMPTARMRKELGPMLLQFVKDLQDAMARSPGPHLLPPEIYTP
ncbi:IclR family transcriptional regulator [Alicycliphilus denitrificans]|uniref:IclR family transcriptional regulator n=1 Tax=Alicycliphilus denitrificans TaxID=179636 RepID=UPI003A7F813D